MGTFLRRRAPERPSELPPTPSMLPPKPTSRLARLARRVLGVALALLVLLASLLVSLLVHLSLPEARSLARVLIEDLASDALRGDLDIGRVDELGLGRARFSDVVLYDEGHRVVIAIPELTVWPDLHRLLDDGTIRIAGAHAERPFVRLYTVDAAGRLDPDGLEVSLVQAFLPSRPGDPDGEPVHILLDGLRLEEARVVGDVPRYPGIVGDELDVYGRIDIEREVRIEVYDAHGRLTGPYPGETTLDRVVLDFTTEWREGLDAYVIAHREGSRVDARVRLDDPGDGALRLAIRAWMDPLELETLARMGLVPEGALMGRVRGVATLEGPLDRLELRSALETDAGPLELAGTLEPSGRYRFQGRARGFDLDAIVPGVPPMLLDADATLDLDRTSGSLAPPRVTLELAPFRVLGFVLPSLHAEGHLADDAVVVERLVAPDLRDGAGGTIAGEGRVGYDGSVRLALRLDVTDLGRDPNVARLVPGAHGAVVGDVRVESGPLAEAFRYDVDVAVRGLQYGAVRARHLAARGEVSGDPAHPRVRMALSGEGLVAGSVALGVFRAALRGGPERYQLSLDLSGGHPIRSAHLEASALALQRGGFELEASALSLETDAGRFAQASPSRVRVGSFGARFDAFALVGSARGGVAPRVSIEGAIGPARADGLRVAVSDFALEALAPQLGDALANLEGRLQGTLGVEGPLRAPSIVLEGSVAQLSFDRVRAADLVYRFSHDEGVLRARVEATLGDRGTILVDGPIALSFDELFDRERWTRDADFGGVRFAVDQVGVPFILPLLGVDNARLGIVGKFSMSGELHGTLEHPSVDRFVLILDRVAPEGWTPMRVKLELGLFDRALTLRHLWLADVDGEIALAEGRFSLPEGALPASVADAVAAISREPWNLALRLEPRRLQDWPRPLSRELPEGVTLGGSIAAAGGPEGAHARIDASLRWDTSGFADACARREPPTVQIVGETAPDAARPGRRGGGDARHRRTRVVATVFADGRSIGSVELGAETPIDEWLARGELPDVPEVLASFTLDDVPLGRLPFTCAHAAGRASGRGSITLFSREPALTLDVDVNQLRIRDQGSGASRPYDVALRAMTTGADWSALAACAIVSEDGAPRTPIAQCPLAPLAVVAEDRSDAFARASSSGVMPLEGEAILRGAIPIRFERSSPVPELGLERALFVDGRFSMAHLEPLLVAAPGLSRADAIGDGAIELTGRAGELRLSGGLQLSEGSARILALGQQLEGIEGFLALRGNRVVIDRDHPVVASDPAGRIAVDGEIGFEGLLPTWMDLHVTPDGFPFRREGAVLANLFGEVGLRLRVGADGLDGELRTHAFDVRLPDRMAGSVMALEARREIQVIGEDAFELAGTSEARYPYRLHLDASEPFTVQRNDFTAELTAALDLVYADPELVVTGSAVLRSGTFEIFGKRFAITRGSLLFLEEAPLDPVIDLVATYLVPGRTGSSISIEVGGRLSDMTITFTSTETSDVGEILALLVSGASSRSTEETAAEAGGQAANFVAGLTAGLLTLTLRRELGDVGNVVPAVSIETAGDAGTLRARAYWDASMIIPDFLRDVVLGASVEGFITSDRGGGVGGSSGASGTGGTGGGVTIELQFPYGLRSTGTYVPPQSWGADVLWQP